MDVHHVLAAIGDSDSADSVVEFAAEFAKKHGARMTLLHVIEAPPSFTVTSAGQTVNGNYGFGTSKLVSCVLVASTLATGQRSARVSASEKVIPRNDAVGAATRQPNHMLLSGAPIRIVARPPPLGRFDTDGTGAGAC